MPAVSSSSEELGNRSIRTLPKTPKDLECFPAESHHPQSISHPGRELFFISNSSLQQKILGVSTPKWNKQGGRGDEEGDVSSPAPTQTQTPSLQQRGCSLQGKALRTKAKVSASLFQAPGTARRKMSSPGAQAGARPRAATPPGSPKQPCPHVDAALPTARELSTQNHRICGLPCLPADNLGLNFLASPPFPAPRQSYLGKSRPGFLSNLPSAMGSEVAKWLKRKRESHQSLEGTGLAGGGCYSRR